MDQEHIRLELEEREESAEKRRGLLERELEVRKGIEMQERELRHEAKAWEDRKRFSNSLKEQISAGEVQVRLAEETRVEFYTLSEKEIKEYIETGEPMDKAGAYGIQGKGALIIKRINGDYYNVMGLPVARLSRELML